MIMLKFSPSKVWQFHMFASYVCPNIIGFQMEIHGVFLRYLHGIGLVVDVLKINLLSLKLQTIWKCIIDAEVK